MPTILVCGGRDFTDYILFSYHLDKICLDRKWIYEKDGFGNWLPQVHVIHGGAKGADALADRWAVNNWTGLTVYPADWDNHCKAAGPIRNQQMLVEGKPDLVVAFPTPNSRGTWDMVRRAKKAGVETIIVQ